MLVRFSRCRTARSREPWGHIRAVPGVFDFLSIQGRPASLADDAIAAIEAREQQLEAARQRKLAQLAKRDRPMFVPGQAVSLDLGPFVDIAGKIGKVGERGISKCCSRWNSSGAAPAGVVIRTFRLICALLKSHHEK